ncbi:MAG: hypothetical protein JNN30_15470 [Rhodanobacteraceae bacterium]|nr:hypothetical protein [Rhodanobacteraceae bacterium]
MKWVSAVSVALLPLAVITAVAAESPPSAMKDRVVKEGLRDQRGKYEAERRSNPDDANFISALARLQAYDQVREAERSSRDKLPLAYQFGERWQSIGPAPLLNGQTPTFPIIPSPVSGRVTSLAIDTIDNAVYAGGAQGGIWRTLNGGATWTPLTDHLGSLAIGSIALAPGAHPINQGTIYIGTGEGNYSADSYGGVGVYKSTDSGRTWQGPYGTALFAGRSVNSLAVDRANPNHLVAATGSGVYGLGASAAIPLLPRGIFNSNDGGVTWTKATTQIANDPASTLIQDPVTPTTWWVAMIGFGTLPGSGGVQKSIDNGVTWTQVFGTATGLPALSGTLGRSWITGSNPGGGNPSVLYIGTGEPNTGIGGGKVYKSIDGGTTWTELAAARGYCQGQCFYDLPVYTEPGNPNIVYTGGAGNSADPETTPSFFMRSNDGGTTFASKVRSPSTNTALHADVHSIVSWPGRPNEIWVGNDGGIWKSTDRGDTWQNLNTSLQLTQFQACDTHPSDPNIAYGGTQDNGTNGWTGSTAWPHLDFGDGGFALIDQTTPTNLVHTYYNQTNNLIGVGYTTAGFVTQQGDYLGSFADSAATGNGIGFSDRVLFYAPIHLDRGVSDTLYFGTHKLYRANAFFSFPDQTPNIFTALGGGADLAPGGVLSAIETLANPAVGLNAQVIFTGSNNGRVFRSIDGGLSFTEVDALPAVIPQYVSDILVDPRNPNIVYQSRSAFNGSLPARNVRKSIDGGSTWTDSSTGLPDVPVNALAFDPVVPNTIWAGTDVGAFLSSDGGSTWIPYNEGLPNVAIFDLKSNRTTGSILACTHGRGAFRLKLDAIFIDGFER